MPSKRWTIFDSYLSLLLLVLVIRVAVPGPSVSDVADPERAAPAKPLTAPATPRPDQMLRALRIAMPPPADAAAHGPDALLETVSRCTGLEAVWLQTACGSARGIDCRALTAHVRGLHEALWAEARDTAMVREVRDRVAAYSQGYGTLMALSAGRHGRTSELILQRDSAMCKRYQDVLGTRANEQEDRQPG